MAQTLELIVVWPDSRTVRVHCRSWSILNNRGDEPDPKTVILDAADVLSLDALHTFLRRATRFAPAGAVVEIAGYDSVVITMLEVLDIVGPPPPLIRVRLDSA
ncbi:hypothetical protein [Actinoplanes sp. HUAS TT8]|uniref:hypothetical protein n=1 Tax=Actinoplanes sp. HUAS TT8 TaxID=3447453 RepID=UPI003F525809